MNYYITCKPNPEGLIQAFFETPTKISFELALVEIVYSLSWKVTFGSIGLIVNDVEYSQEVVCFDYSPHDVLQDAVDSIIASNKLKCKPVIKYDYARRQLFFDSSDKNVQIKLGQELVNQIKAPLNSFQKLKVSCGQRLEKCKLMNIYCDVIDDQIIGDSKEKLLRTYKITGDCHKISSMVYIYPQYMALSRSTFQYINISVLDEKNNQIKFEEEVFFKLHLRQKR